MLTRGYVVLVKVAEFNLGLAANRQRRQIDVVEFHRRTVGIACGERMVVALPAGCVERREWTNGRRLTANVTLRGA